MTFILFVLIFSVLALTVVVFFAGTHVSDLTRANASLENQTHAMQKSAETWRRAFFKLRTQALEAGFDLDHDARATHVEFPAPWKTVADVRAAAYTPINFNCRSVLDPTLQTTEVFNPKFYAPKTKRKSPARKKRATTRKRKAA